MIIIFLIFAVLINSCNFTIAAINDVRCDTQLEYFNQGLSKREKWSIECMSWLKTLEIKKKHNEISFSAGFMVKVPVRCIVRKFCRFRTFWSMCSVQSWFKRLKYRRNQRTALHDLLSSNSKCIDSWKWWHLWLARNVSHPMSFN